MMPINKTKKPIPPIRVNTSLVVIRLVSVMIKKFSFLLSTKTWFPPEAGRRADVFIITQNYEVRGVGFEPT